GQFVLLGLQQEGIEAAAVLDGAERSSGNAKTETLAEGVGNQRDIAQVRQELALRLVVCVAHIVARLDALAGQFATTGHGTPIFLGSGQYVSGTETGRSPSGLFGKLRFYSHRRRRRQAKPAVHPEFSCQRP